MQLVFWPSIILVKETYNFFLPLFFLCIPQDIKNQQIYKNLKILKILQVATIYCDVCLICKWIEPMASNYLWTFPSFPNRINLNS
jgi:hypothetical protein